MKTDELIETLSMEVAPVAARQVVRTVGVAIAAGAAAAVAAAILTLGLRTDLADRSAVAFLLLKLCFTVGIAAPAAVSLVKLARPGGERRISVALAVLPLATLPLLAALSLALMPVSRWGAMILGNGLPECLQFVLLIGVVPFAAVICAMRRMAPTSLSRTGAMAGLLAGSVGAIGYALHCTDDSLPFIALWYGGTIGLWALAGALMGPRLLRW